MKPLSLALFLVLAAATGAATAGAVLYAMGGAPAPAQAPAAAGPASAAAAPAAGDEEMSRVQAELRMLSGRVAELTQQLALVRSAAERQPVAQAEPEQVQPAEAVAVPRQQVETILAELRQEEERQRELERQERERRLVEQRAERIARELGLAPADQTRLAGFMNEANTKRQELMTQVRENGFDRDAMRASFQELRQWSNDELTRTFGAPLAEQILDASDDFGPRGGWGGRGNRRGDGAAGPAGS